MTAPDFHSRGEEAAAYVLGHMDAVERAAFVRSMNQDLSLRALVDDLAHTAASLSYCAPQAGAPTAVRQRVLDNISSLSQDATAIPLEIPDAPKPPKRSPVWLGWAVAAGFAIVGGAVLFSLFHTRQELAANQAQLQQYSELSERSAKVTADAMDQIQKLVAKLGESDKTAGELQNQLARNAEVTGELKQQLQKSETTTQMLQQELAERAKANDALKVELANLTQANDVAKMQIATLQSTVKEYKQGVAVVVWNSETQEGILKLEKMPPLDSGKDYQLWVVDPSKKKPVDAGVVTVDAKGFAKVEFKPVLDIEQADKFALSVEKKGGVPEGEGPIVLLSR